jgi:hypothetical protein
MEAVWRSLCPRMRKTDGCRSVLTATGAVDPETSPAGAPALSNSVYGAGAGCAVALGLRIADAWKDGSIEGAERKERERHAQEQHHQAAVGVVD